MQAIALYEALTTLADILDGMLCQPRFNDVRQTSNPAGEALSDLRDQITASADAAMAAAARSEPRERYERLFWAEARLRHAARGADSVEEIVAFAHSLAWPKS